MRITTYCGQSLEGYTHIGTDALKFPITSDMDVQATIKELKRRCGSRCSIQLFAMDQSRGR